MRHAGMQGAHAARGGAAAAEHQPAALTCRSTQLRRTCHAGTLSGNPLAMTAGIKTLEILDRPGSYEYLDKITSRWVGGTRARRVARCDVTRHARGVRCGVLLLGANVCAVSQRMV